MKIQQDLQDAIKAEGNASVVLKKAPTTPKPICQNMGNHIGESSFRTDENVNGTWIQYTQNSQTKWRYLVFRFLDESFGDIFVRLYDSIGTSCILRYINYHGFAR